MCSYPAPNNVDDFKVFDKTNVPLIPTPLNALNLGVGKTTAVILFTNTDQRTTSFMVTVSDNVVDVNVKYYQSIDSTSPVSEQFSFDVK